MAVERADLYIAPETNLPKQVYVGRLFIGTVVVLNADGTRRDMTSDTLEVVAKAIATGDALTYTWTADANQTTTGIGNATLSLLAAQHTTARIGSIKIDLAIDDAVYYSAVIELIASDAE